MKNRIFQAALLATFVLFNVACNKEKSDPVNGVSVKILTKYSPTNLKRANQSIHIDEMWINISEIEFELKNYPDSLVNEDEFKGPFEIKIIENNMPKDIILSDNVKLPEGLYSEIEFEIDKNPKPNSITSQSSIVIFGRVGSQPLEIKIAEDFEFEQEFDIPLAITNTSQITVSLIFDISMLFDPTKGGIDITQAIDGNQNGILEIGPNNIDGNENLYERIKELIEQLIDVEND